MQTPPTQLTGGSVAMMPSPFDSFVMAINANPYFIGLMMLALNLGGRFIGLELTKAQENFLQNVWVRRLLIFVVLFMGTRNVLVAFWMWLAVIFLLGYVLNENSSMCIFGSGLPGSKCASGAAAEGFAAPALTPEESQVYSILKAKAEKNSPPQEEKKQGQPLPQAPTQGVQVAPQATESKAEEPKEESFVDTYLQEMSALRAANANPRF